MKKTVETTSFSVARNLCPWASYFVPEGDYYVCFEFYDDYITYLSQE